MTGDAAAPARRAGSGPARGVDADAAVVGDYDALRRGIGAFRWPLDVVVAAGPQALEYLQGQLSQDLAPLVVGSALPALLLEPDGKLCALLRVTRTDDDTFALDVEGGFGPAVLARLRRFRLRTKVELEPADWPCVALRGSAVQPADVGAGAQGGPWVLPVSWNGTSGVDLIGPGAEAAVPGQARWCSPEAWEALRIEAGIPRMGAELDERTIAAEAGLVERTVSFSKGCYTGQELVARLDARGNRVARRLCGVVLEDAGTDGGAVAGGIAGLLAGATLWGPESEKSVGRCTSAAWCPGLGRVAGLAYLHRSVEVPSELRWQAGDGPPAGTAAGISQMGGREESSLVLRAVPLPLVGG